ncbi:hypothetical protein Tco_0747919 [Tanacetum coccineum]|uniref:Uncharacterized protein n=1 Tax=Tanacetum coccineum TaxID=301880 RepID=A0ABQ4YX51_9ASTR
MNKFMNTIRSPEGILHALIQIVPYSVKRPSFASYGDVVTLKRRRDDQDEDKDEEPSAGQNRGSKRRRARKEPESTSTLKENTSKPSGKSKEGFKPPNTSTGKSDQAEEPIHANVDLEEPTHQEFDIGVTKDQPIDETTQLPEWFQKPEKSPTPDRNWNKTLHAAHGPVQPWLSTLAQKEESHSLVELEYFFEEVYKATTDQLDWNNPGGQQYPHDLRKPLPMIPNSRGRQVIPFDHFINNDLEYLNGGVLSQTYTTLVIKTKAANYGHIKWIEDLVPNTMWIQVPELASNVYFKCRIIAVTKLQINYKHLDWITIHLKRKEAYTAYSNPRGFIYQNKDKKNKLIHIDELHKFSDGTLNDVRTALDDLLKGIRMKYLPQAIWRKSDRDKAGVMIQAIDKQLKTRRIMRSLEKFIGGRLYEGDFRLLQRTI